MPKFVWLILLLLPVSTHAITLPKNSAVPGGIAVVELGTTAEIKTSPRAEFRSQQVMVLKNDHQWYAIVGLPLALTPGEYEVSYLNGARKQSKRFVIQDKTYDVQRLNIKNKRMVNPTAEDLIRIKNEQTLIETALKSWTPADDVETGFVIPAEGPFSSPFGLRRFFNNEPRNPHTGLDIAAPAGTEVRAPAPGKVVEVGDFFFNGNVVFLDHGQGLISFYAHLESVAVKKGQTVKANEPIGKVGMTGRATGPHLHWSVSLNNARVDPKLFLHID